MTASEQHVLRHGGEGPADAGVSAAPQAFNPEQALGVLPTIAHELRGPVHTLMASVEILLEDLESLDVKQIRVMLVRMYRQLLWQQGLLENLLAVATIPDGRVPLLKRPIRLDEAVAEIELIVEPLLVHKNQRFRVRAHEPVPAVAADSRRIGQVLINLIQNASKYSPPDTPIDVDVVARGNVVRVTVADRGPGLPPEGAQALFTPFYRAARPDLATKEGVGLGLAVVHAIVAEHGGRVGAEPRSGGGACFWFEIPALPA